MNFAFLRRNLIPALIGGVLCQAALPAFAQDSAFLACERFTDRGQRIACLEDALEAATEETGTTQAPAAPAAPPTTSVAPAPRVAPAAPPVATPAPAANTAEARDDDPSLLERLRNFGRDDEATISTDAEGQDQLHDTIASLEKRRDLWIVTLAGGQVWMQEYPRTLNLREGDTITIYQAGFGNGYRLATDRLSGFIRVKRMR